MSGDATAMLDALVGLPWVITRRTADLRGFHFGRILSSQESWGLARRGQYVLHLSSFWRLRRGRDLVVARDDLWRPTRAHPWADGWDYEQGNLQDERLAALFPEYRDEDRSCYASASGLVVASASWHDDRDLAIIFGDGLILEAFDDGGGEMARIIDVAGHRHAVFPGTLPDRHG